MQIKKQHACLANIITLHFFEYTDIANIKWNNKQHFFTILVTTTS
jgi:hypothetical protein